MSGSDSPPRHVPFAPIIGAVIPIHPLGGFDPGAFALDSGLGADDGPDVSAEETLLLSPEDAEFMSRIFDEREHEMGTACPSMAISCPSGWTIRSKRTNLC